MALFDLNSRYTKSMEHGGSYERDASIGGYNRKELRGLNRQAKRGTLTQRERARLKYLTDERRGRRKRGLLSGLGGAAATLGALAAAGKLGEGEGGSALMDAIKDRLKQKSLERNISRSNKQKVLEDAKNYKPEAVGDYDPMSDIQDIPLSKENIIEDELYSSNMQLPPEPRDTPAADRISESMGADRAEQVSDAQEVLDLLMQSTTSDPITSEGPVRGTTATTPQESNDPMAFIQDLVRERGAANQASMISSENPQDSALQAPSFGREVPLGDMLTQAELDAEDALPGRVGEQPTQSPGPKVANLLKALEKAPRKKVDSIFKLLNSMGLDGGEAQYNPDEVAVPDYLPPRVRPISQGNPNRNLPQLEALQQLRSILGNRYR